MKKNIKNNEVDLVGLFVKIWEDKIKILFSIIICLLIAIIYISVSKIEKQFTIETDIKTISFPEESKYALMNEVIRYSAKEMGYNYSIPHTDGLFEIDKKILFELFTKFLKDELILSEAIINYKLLDKEKYKNDKDFYKAVSKYNSLINIKQSSQENQYKMKDWKIISTHNDVNQWRDFLLYVEKKINEEIKDYLSVRFNVYIDTLDKLNNFIIEDLNNQIYLEEEKIRSLKVDSLEYLKKHSLTAKTLGIKDVSKELTLIFSSNDSRIKDEVFATIGEEQLILDYMNPSYYLMGYNFIDNRIQQIEDTLNDDKLISINTLMLDQSRKELISGKIINRLKKLYEETPLNNSEEFTGAYFDIENSKIYKSSKIITKEKIIALGIILGLLIGILNTLIFSNIKKQIQIFSKRIK